MVKIVADTTSCIPLDLAIELGIPYFPQIIVIGDETYRDDTEMNSIEFLKRLKTSSVLPKTAAPPPALYTPIFKECAERGETILVLTPSAEVSGTARSATVAAQDFPSADIRVIDTKIIAGGLGTLVFQANEWARQGLDADAIVAKVTDMATRNRTYFLVDTLEYLYKGGRIGAASALFGSILQVKPILAFRNGHTEPFESQRTKKKAIARLKEVILKECPRDPRAHFCVMHGDAEDEAIQFASEIAEMLGIPLPSIPIYDLTPAILVHAGPGIICVSFFVD